MIILNNKYPLAWVRYTLLAFMLVAPVGLFAFVTNAGFNFVDNKTRTIIPFEIVDNLIVIPVVINEGIPVHLILDTGVRSIVLFGNHFKKKLKVYAKRTVPLSGYGKKSKRVAKLSLDNDVRVADIEGNGIGILITPNNRLFTTDNQVKVEGLIGYQIFSRFSVAIDYVNKKIVLEEPEPGQYYEGFTQLPLIIKDTKPYIQADLNVKGKEVGDAHFHVDTGSAREIILFMKSKTPELPENQYKKGYVGHGLRGMIEGYKLSGVDIGIGDKSYASSKTYMIEREFSDRELQEAVGTLGSGFFKDFVIVLDYPNQKFYFRKGQSGEHFKLSYLKRSDPPKNIWYGYGVPGSFGTIVSKNVYIN